MADFSPDYTTRFKLRYRVQSVTHSLVWRGQLGSSDVSQDVADKMGAFLDSLSPILYTDFQIVSLERAAPGENVFLPTGVTVGFSGGEVDPVVSGRRLSQKAAYVRFEGRTTQGSRVNFSLYGTNQQPNSSPGEDFRVTPSELPILSAALVAIQETGGFQLRGIDGNLASLYPYVNIGYNGHWQRRVRNGS